MKRIFLLVVTGIFLFSCSNNRHGISQRVLAEMKVFADSCHYESQQSLINWKDTISSLSDKKKSDKEIFTVAFKFGHSLLKAGRQADAVLYYKGLLKAFDNSQVSDNELENEFLMGIYVCLGAALEETGLKNTALSTYREGLELAKRIDDQNHIAMLLNNIGVIYDNVNDLDGALDYFNKALQINLSLKDKNLKEIYLNYMNISSIYEKKGDIEKAIDLALKALQYIKPSDGVTHYAHAVTLSILYKKIGNSTLALSYVDNAIANLDTLPHVPMLINAMQVKSDILMDSGNADEAMKVNSRAILKAKEIGNQRTHHTLLKQRAEIEKLMGNPVEAYALIEESEAMRDSLSQLDAADHLTQLQTLLNREPSHESFIQRQSPVSIFIISSLIVIILLLIMAFFWLKSRKKTDDLEEVSQKKEVSDSLLKETLRKTSLILLERARSNELLTSLTDELKELSHTINFRDTADRNKLIVLIKKFNRLTQRTDWKELQFYLENSNEEFVSALEQRFPDLTTKDKRLCLLIRLMLSNKEIAALTSLEVKSVETARIRLRKKMGLDREVNMTDYLRAL